MTGEPWDAVLDELDAERVRPLGRARESSHHLLSPVSDALSEAAGHLLVKAIRALDAGDDVRARRFVDRALALPYDEHEELLPGWWEASMFLDTTVAHRLETCAAGDTSWLDAAEAVLADADPRSAEALRASLPTFADDHALSAGELRRCRRAAGGLRPDHWVDNMVDDPAERADVVLGVLAMILAYTRWPDGR